MKVSLFVTCLVDQLFPEVGTSTVKVLKRLGVEVDFDSRQTCCGQPAFNSGHVDEARQVAARFLEVFAGNDPIVAPSGSCAAMIKVFLPGLFPPHSSEHARARQIAERTHELSDFLDRVLQVEGTGARFPEVVTYHDSCHLLRELGVSSPPRRLIRSVREIQFREMEDGQRCCGFGGTFSVKFPDVSAAIGGDKVESIRGTGARWVISNDVGCLMHLRGLLERQRMPVRTMHLAELLAQFDD